MSRPSVRDLVLPRLKVMFDVIVREPGRLSRRGAGGSCRRGMRVPGGLASYGVLEQKSDF